MKTNYIYTLLLFILISSCKKENETIFIPKNYLTEFKTNQSQFFKLDTLEVKEITGKHGTKIMYSRDFFELQESDKVQLELIELYDFKEILYRNIQTLTTNNELLETSGVLKITFTSNGKKLDLKKGEKIIIYPPKGKLKNNDIFLSETDSLGNIKWEITNQDYTEIIFSHGGGINSKRIIKSDSLNYYSEYLKNDLLGYESNNKSKDYFILNDNSWNWINIDRFVKDTPRINFKLNDKSNKFSGFDSYIMYKNINSFMSEPKFKDDLLFENIPISGPTHIIVIGSHKSQIYYDKLELNQALNNSELSLNMKKTSKENLKKLFDK